MKMKAFGRKTLAALLALLLLSQAAADAGRGFQVVSTMRQAADHPVALSFPEGFYLKGALIRAI